MKPRVCWLLLPPFPRVCSMWDLMIAPTLCRWLSQQYSGFGLWWYSFWVLGSFSWWHALCGNLRDWKTSSTMFLIHVGYQGLAGVDHNLALDFTSLYMMLSSVNSQHLEFKRSRMSLMKARKRTGPSILLCSIQDVTAASSEYSPSTTNLRISSSGSLWSTPGMGLLYIVLELFMEMLVWDHIKSFAWSPWWLGHTASPLLYLQ